MDTPDKTIVEPTKAFVNGFKYSGISWNPVDMPPTRIPIIDASCNRGNMLGIGVNGTLGLVGTTLSFPIEGQFIAI